MKDWLKTYAILIVLSIGAALLVGQTIHCLYKGTCGCKVYGNC